MNKIKGLIAAPFTAFDLQGELNLDAIARQAEHLVANGVTGALVGGTTGECGSMTLEERKALTSKWCEATADKPDFPVFAHVGHSCLKDSQDLAAHAAAAGVQAIAALAPYYFKPANVDILAAHCREIAAAAPDLPFYYYNLPSITGVSIPVIELLRTIGDTIPNFAGIKYTHEDLFDFGLCLEFGERKYDVLCGRDEFLLAALALGANGAVGSTYNYMAPIYHTIIKAFEENDLPTAQRSQELVRRVIEIMVKFGGIPAAKMIMRMIGMDCGQARLPLAEMNDDTYEKFRQELEAVGFFNVSSRLTNSWASPNL